MRKYENGHVQNSTIDSEYTEWKQYFKLKN